jgi:hypothetical protein
MADLDTAPPGPDWWRDVGGEWRPPTDLRLPTPPVARPPRAWPVVLGVLALLVFAAGSLFYIASAGEDDDEPVGDRGAEALAAWLASPDGGVIEGFDAWYTEVAVALDAAAGATDPALLTQACTAYLQALSDRFGDQSPDPVLQAYTRAPDTEIVRAGMDLVASVGQELFSCSKGDPAAAEQARTAVQAVRARLSTLTTA